MSEMPEKIWAKIKESVFVLPWGDWHSAPAEDTPETGYIRADVHEKCVLDLMEKAEYWMLETGNLQQRVKELEAEKKEIIRRHELIMRSFGFEYTNPDREQEERLEKEYRKLLERAGLQDNPNE